MRYKVVDKKGIFYTRGQSTEINIFPENSFIVEEDIKAGCLTRGGVEALIKAKRLVRIKEKNDDAKNDDAKITEKQGDK